MLFILVPGGIENVIRATSEPTASRTLPPPPEAEPTPDEVERLKAIVKEDGYELLVRHAHRREGVAKDPTASPVSSSATSCDSAGEPIRSPAITAMRKGGEPCT